MTFGRARLYFVAQNESLEGFLKPGSAPWHGLHHDMSRCNCVLQWLNHAFRRLVLYAIIATAFYAEYYLITRIVVVFREPEVGLITAIISKSPLLSAISHISDDKTNQRGCSFRSVVFLLLLDGGTLGSNDVCRGWCGPIKDLWTRPKYCRYG